MQHRKSGGHDLGHAQSYRWQGLQRFLIGGVLGLPLGIGALISFQKESYIHAVGCFLVIYGSTMLMKKPVIVRQHSLLDILAGVLGGITGGAMGFPGASVSIWCSMKPWSKDQQRAVFQPFILIMQIISLVAISLSQQHTHASASSYDWRILMCVPGALLGTVFGMHLYRRLSDNQFRKAVNIMLIVSGLGYFL